MYEYESYFYMHSLVLIAWLLSCMIQPSDVPHLRFNFKEQDRETGKKRTLESCNKDIVYKTKQKLKNKTLATANT